MLILSDRRLIEITGSDSKKFLQSLITNDIYKLSAKNPLFSCLLTPQGKFLFDFFIYEINSRIIIEINNKFFEQFIKKLNLYKLHTDVEIIAIEGNILFSNKSIDCDNHFRDPRISKEFYRIIDFNLSLSADDNLDLYHKIRIENMLIEGAYDLIQEKSFILHYGYHNLNAVDFSKGCYVGQEVTTRSFRRGVIRKKITSFESVKNLNQGDDLIYSDEQKIGIVAYYNKNIKSGFMLINCEN
ncbi:MAG: folate-binding protein YgfZ [Rickettsiales bacterium]|nr:folate-binding protein YgfZ [Rickettsiales bacterium]